ncbi:hypothetical protein ScPMuIL_004976 [Solemya velum]
MRLWALKQEVLGLYRRILRFSKTWEALSGHLVDTVEEQKYIKNEAAKLFRKNKKIEDLELVEQHIKEGEARMQLALHYKNPYPRPVNIPQNALPPRGKKLKKAQKRILDQAKPLYLKSYDDIT